MGLFSIVFAASEAIAWTTKNPTMRSSTFLRKL
jgi:hypothetical protein